MPLRDLWEGITTKNMIPKQELIDLATFTVRKNPCLHLNNLIETFFEYEKSIKSSADEVKVCADCKYYKAETYHDQMWCRDCQQKNHFEQTE